MQCSNCGFEVHETDQFCPNCGARFEPDEGRSGARASAPTPSAPADVSTVANEGRIRQVLIGYAVLSVVLLPVGMVTIFSRYPSLRGESISAVFNLPAQVAFIVLWAGVAYGVARRTRWARIAVAGTFGLVGLMGISNLLHIVSSSLYTDGISVLLDLVPLPYVVYQLIPPLHGIAAIAVGIFLAVQDGLWESEGSQTAPASESSGIGVPSFSLPTAAAVPLYGLAGIVMAIIPIFLTDEFPLLAPEVGVKIAGLLGMVGGVMVLGSAAIRTIDDEGTRARSLGVFGTLVFLLGTILLFLV